MENVDYLAIGWQLPLLWYGYWWTQPEDFGFAVGIIVKEVFDVNFE